MITVTVKNKFTFLIMVLFFYENNKEMRGARAYLCITHAIGFCIVYFFIDQIKNFDCRVKKGGYLYSDDRKIDRYVNKVCIL